MPGRDDNPDAPRIDVALLDRPIEIADLAFALHSGAGAESVFIGRTRGETHPDHGALEALDYHAYRSMAQRTMKHVANDVAVESGVFAIIVRHSVGRVAVGEASVGVAVLAGHREDSFPACRAIIDRVKAEAPIWKREVWANGATWQAGTAAPAEAGER